MDYIHENPCTRCGKERIFSKAWKEKMTTFSGSVIEVEHTQYVCPDRSCQKIVDAKLQVELEKRKVIQQRKEQRLKSTSLKRNVMKFSFTKKS